MITGTIKPQEVKAERPTQFIMIKNTEGSLTVRLEAHDYSVPSRPIKFKFDQERNYIPAKWALGVFVTPSALKQMELGYFTFDNLNTLIEMAEDLGYYVPDSIKETKITLKEIANALRSGEKEQLEKITRVIDVKLRQDLIATAQKMYNILNNGTISFLENKLKVSLKPVNLSE